MAAEVACLINVHCFPGPSLSAPRQVEEALVLAQTTVRAVSAPGREVARANNDPVIVLEVAESQNRQAERDFSPRPPSTNSSLVLELLFPGSLFGLPEIERAYN